MSITVEFKDFEEMKDFARNLLGAQASTNASVSVPAAPAAAYIPTAPAVCQPPVAPVTLPVQAPVPTAPPDQSMQQPVVPVTPAVPTPPVPTTPVSYTQDDLARAAMTLMDCGKQGMLQELLKSFGVEALPALPAAQYGAFATALRGMGAQI